MSMLRFILFLFKHGSLKGKPLDFEKRKSAILQRANTKIPQNAYKKLRTTLIANPYTTRLLSALAYLRNYKQVNRHYFFIDKHELCYVRIFKSASTSIVREILPIMDSKIDAHKLSDQQIDLLADDYRRHTSTPSQKNYTWFTVVRNPFHRIVSVYLDLFAADNTFFSYQTYFFGIFKRDMSFKQFILTLANIPDKLKSPHFASQHQIIQDCDSPDTVTIFRLEKDEEELNAFLSTYNITLSHRNKSNNSYDYMQYYDQQILDVVYAIYKNDIRSFDYQQEYEMLSRKIQFNSKNNL